MRNFIKSMMSTVGGTIGIFVGLFLCLGLLCIVCVLPVAVGSPLPTPSLTPISVSKPINTKSVVVHLSTPDSAITCQTIRENYDKMTEFQFNQYAPTLVGKETIFYGSVIEVDSDGNLQLDSDCGAGLFSSTVIVLYGANKDLLLNVNKDDSVHGRGTIRLVENL